MIKDQTLRLLFVYLWKREESCPVNIEEFRQFFTDASMERYLTEIYAADIDFPSERLVVELATSIKDVVLKERYERLFAKIRPQLEDNTLEKNDEDYIEYMNIKSYLRRKGIRI